MSAPFSKNLSLKKIKKNQLARLTCDYSILFCNILFFIHRGCQAIFVICFIAVLLIIVLLSVSTHLIQSVLAVAR